MVVECCHWAQQTKTHLAHIFYKWTCRIESWISYLPRKHLLPFRSVVWSFHRYSSSACCIHSPAPKCPIRLSPHSLCIWKQRKNKKNKKNIKIKNIQWNIQWEVLDVLWYDNKDIGSAAECESIVWRGERECAIACSSTGDRRARAQAHTQTGTNKRHAAKCGSSCCLSHGCSHTYIHFFFLLFNIFSLPLVLLCCFQRSCLAPAVAHTEYVLLGDQLLTVPSGT